MRHVSGEMHSYTSAKNRRWQYDNIHIVIMKYYLIMYRLPNRDYMSMDIQPGPGFLYRHGLFYLPCYSMFSERIIVG